MIINNGTTNAFIIDSNGKIGINNSTPTTTLDVLGTIKGANIIGDGYELRNVYLGDRNTSMLAEGSNLYYTAQRVGTIVSSSNVETSNLIANNSNAISSFLIDTSNIISSHILFTSNYIQSTSNNLIELINRLDSNTSNNLISTSNAISQYMITNDSNTSNYIVSTSNYLNNIVKDTSNAIEGRLTYTSNAIEARLTNILIYNNISLDNITQGTSNKFITNNAINSDLNINGTLNANEIYINGVNFSASNSAIIGEIMADNVIQGNINKFIVNNKYNHDLKIEGTLEVDNIIVNNSISVINNSVYNSECLNIFNYTDNNSLNINHNGNGDIIDIKNKYNATLFKIDNKGYIGNIPNPLYNIDINGTINASYFRGSGCNISNINLKDKTSDDLKEGDNNLYFNTERVLDVLNNPANASNSYLNSIYDNIIGDISEVQEQIACISLNRIEQGTSNKYIINNVYNDSMYIDGILTVRGINIIDESTIYDDYYNELYYSNMYHGKCYMTGHSDYIASNISNIVYSILDNYDIGDNSNYDSNFILDVISSNNNFADNDNVISIYSNINRYIDDVKESMDYISLDNVIQGNKNNYIVNNIYNSNLIINGTLTVRNIILIDNDEDYYNRIYNCNLYNPENNSINKLLNSSNYIKNVHDELKTNIDNIYESFSYIYSSNNTILMNKLYNLYTLFNNTSNIQANTINLLKNDMNNMIQRITILENR